MKEIEAEFIKLVEENKPMLVKISSFYAFTAEDRQDLLAEMVYQLWKAYPSFEYKSKISTWLYRVCLNVAVGYNRLRKKEGCVVHYDCLPDYLLNMEEAAEDKENVELLYKFINQLDTLNKSLILLYLDELKYSEIAGILGLSETNVGVRINRIKTELRKHFK